MAATDMGPLCFEGFTLDPAARTLVGATGECISLRRSEFELLLAFASKPGRALSRDYLLEVVAGRPSEAFDRSIDVLVGRLRRKIEREPSQPKLIITVPGIGYRFAATPRSVRNDVLQAIVAPRLSIVVLPFTNFSNHPEQQYFADGITEDLTSDLSRITDSFVISRNTAFTYRNKPIETKQIGRELGVRYVLEGSVRRSGSQVRVNAQLIDAENDRHVWAERFNGNTSELFALQDEITSRIAVALGIELAAAEATRPTDNPDALDYILRGRAAWLKPNTRESFAERISMYEHALALDSRSVEAQSLLARVLIGRVLDQMADSPAADMERAEWLIGQALAASPRFYLPHYARGQLLRVKLRHAEAIPEYQTVIELNRNEPGAYANLAWCKLLTGAIEEAIPGLQQALRLSPRDHRGGNWYARIGLVHLLQSRTDEALIWLRRAGSTSPALPYVHAFLASAYGLRGETERAVAELAEARGLSSEGSSQTIAKMKAERSLSPKTRALFEATYFAGLRKAGMPEE